MNEIKYEASFGVGIRASTYICIYTCRIDAIHETIAAVIAKRPL